MSPTLPCQLHQYHNEKNFILFYFLRTRWRNVRGKEYNSNQTRQEQSVRSSKRKVGKSQGQAKHPKTQQDHDPVSSLSAHSSSMVSLLLLIKCQVTDCPTWRHLQFMEGGTWITVVKNLYKSLTSIAQNRRKEGIIGPWSISVVYVFMNVYMHIW